MAARDASCARARGVVADRAASRIGPTLPGFGGDQLRDAAYFFAQLFRRQRRDREKAHLPGAGSVDPLSGQHQVHGRWLAHRLGKPLCAAKPGDATDPGLGEAELASIGGKDQVAREHQFEASAQREPVNLR